MEKTLDQFSGNSDIPEEQQPVLSLGYRITVFYAFEEKAPYPSVETVFTYFMKRQCLVFYRHQFCQFHWSDVWCIHNEMFLCSVRAHKLDTILLCLGRLRVSLCCQ